MHDTVSAGAASEIADVVTVAAPQRPPLYLRIAVTGHRDAPRLNADRARVGIAQAFDICAGIVQSCQASGFYAGTRAEMVLLSALAEGADQLAVETFQARSNPESLSARCEIVLPFDMAGYAATFADPAAAGRMREMARAAAARLILSDGAPELAQPDVDGDEKHWRAQRYAAVGDILIRQADVLIAVWDGVPSVKLGGTGWVIASALREGTPVLWVDSRSGALRLLAPRSRYGDLLGEAARPEGSIPLGTPEAVTRLSSAIKPLLAPEFSDHARAPEEHDFDAYASSKTSYGAFFGEDGQGRPPRTRTWATAYNRLLWITGSFVKRQTTEATPSAHHAQRVIFKRSWPGGKWPGWTIGCVNVPRPLEGRFLPQWGKDRLQQSIAQPWISFDTIATRLGHIYRSSYVVTFLFAAIAVLAALTGLFVHSHLPIAAAEWTSLFIAGASFVLSRHYKVHDRWVIARDMDGQFRAGWNLAQLGLGGRRAPRRKPVSWSSWAVQGWTGYAGVPDIETTPAFLGRLAEYLQQTAVSDQIDYHRSNAERLHMLHHSLELAGKIAFLSAPWLGAVALLHHFEVPLAPHVPGEWIVLFGAGMPAIAAAVAGLRYQGDFLRFATRSRRTAEDLEGVSQALNAFVARMQDQAIPDTHKRNAFVELRDILLELEIVLVTDLQDWRYVYSARPNPEP